MTKKSLNICKRVFYNPLFVSLLLTAIIIIIIVAIYKVQSFGAGMLFKCGFYIFIMLGIIIYVHDFLITRELKLNNVNREVKDVFSGIDLSKEISHDVIQVDPIMYENDENDENSNVSYEKSHERFNKLLNSDKTTTDNTTDNTIPNNEKKNESVLGGTINTSTDAINILDSIVDVTANSTANLTTNSTTTSTTTDDD
jgi:hypothetical protein